jgi:hypothetical protein
MNYVIWGIVVFGLTGLLTGFLGDLMLFGFALMGAIGGASLSWFIGERKKIPLGFLVGTIGFFVGFVAMFFLVLSVWEPPFSLVFIGLFGGAIGGFFLGILFKRFKAMGIMALASGLGFGLGFALIEGLSQWTSLSAKVAPLAWSGVTMMLACVIGGIGVGIGVHNVMKNS